MIEKEVREEFQRIAEAKIDASGIVHGAGKVERDWEYRIEPYRRIRGEVGFTPAQEEAAEMWFGFPEKGDDQRCFGVFPSRVDAEKAMEIMKGMDAKEIKQGIGGM